MSTKIDSFSFKSNIVHEVAAPYYPESNGMAERLIQMLKDRLHHVNKDQGVQFAKKLKHSHECLFYATS